jgi:uncharacterized protein YprB with RNaseH-like and TPR domain
MGSNLRSRLSRIRELGASGSAGPSPEPETSTAKAASRGKAAAALPGPEWVLSGFLTARRTLILDFPPFPKVLPPALKALVPDFLQHTWPLETGDLLFFDLETTGLSGGAGTLAFLAAFGRFAKSKAAGNLILEATQYLLLDYPGENDFLEAALAEFGKGGKPPWMLTYNGKTFDAQILKVRCLMNGMTPPVFSHADLLHPARRLWKRVLPSCSQGEIETAALGLDRTGDVPGAMAPDIWFDYLKNGETGALKGICDHNIKDIYGLARLFHALVNISGNPLGTHSVYRWDLENLALHWRKLCRTHAPLEESLHETGAVLLAEAAERGHPRAAFTLALDLFRRGDFEAGRAWLEKIACHAVRAEHADTRISAAAYRVLAIDAERRLCDREQALLYTEAALDLNAPLSARLREDLIRRRDRLAKKITGS